jgi:outer membrane protein assembly factor BamB
VGITSTPVIDPATNRLFVVADTWNGSDPSSIQHRLVGFNIADGSLVPGSAMVVDPPGSTPPAQLQRTALALEAGKVLIGYGGNYGDCGSYHGWLLAAPETGGSLLGSFEVDKDSNGGAIWGAGNGPAIDSSGNVWVTTGNGFGSTYQYQESVLKLDSSLNLLDHWAPANWSQLDTSDADLASSDPLLLPGGLVFQIGKEGIGYLLSASDLGGTGASPAFQAQVCDQTGHASYGGGVYYRGVIYVACSDGLRALSLNTSTPSFTALPGWQVTSTAIGPPIVAGGLVWATSWNARRLYGLDPQTGQATVTESTPAMEHFTSPAASNGKLFLATGQTVQAYTIANPAPPQSPIRVSRPESVIFPRSSG